MIVVGVVDELSLVDERIDVAELERRRLYNTTPTNANKISAKMTPSTITVTSQSGRGAVERLAGTVEMDVSFGDISIAEIVVSFDEDTRAVVETCATVDVEPTSIPVVV